MAILTLREWAGRNGLALRTAQRWADSGRLDGSDADHPLAWQDDSGRWQVYPQLYAPAPVVEAAPLELSDAVTALIDARVAAAFERVAAQLRGA
ncbi:MAG TPA: hypothetical protein VNM48_10825 [Chloroflexota bacterium]|nr:hypothetical protein [Chloroflexota bacterium]